MSLNPDLLSRAQKSDALEDLRTDLQDTLKEYGELDILVEIIQNSLDAIEAKRYSNIVAAAGLDPVNFDVTEKWNAAVREIVETDCTEYLKLNTNIELATYYKNANQISARRKEWWEVLGKHFSAPADVLEAASTAYSPLIEITFRLDSGLCWLEVEDNGHGMSDIPSCFRHTSSAKRSRKKTPRRLGVRGNHGWGLSAVLGLSDIVEVVSRTEGQECRGYRFSDYASFVSEQIDEPRNEQIDVSAAHALSHRLRTDASATGTHIRIQLAQSAEDNVLGYALKHPSLEKIANLLRLYTPIGQLNDFVAHPAFHTYRKDELTAKLVLHISGATQTKNVPFDIFRISECQGVAAKNLHEYVNGGMPPEHSVHVLHRCKKGGLAFVSGAEIQPAGTLLQQAEDRLKSLDALPEYLDENDKAIGGIPRGFFLGLSGGMRAELHVRPPRGITHAYYAFVLSDDIRPTLGRKHVLDQRTGPPKAATDLENRFEEFRKKTLPKAVPPMATPAAHKWRRDFFNQVIADIKSDPPLTDGLHVRASSSSLEARVMLLFGELLGKSKFGFLDVLRAHLQDKYDFAFIYKAKLGEPDGVTISMGQQLAHAGYAETLNANSEMLRYGLGEFKAEGASVLDDFDENNPRKSADAIDLLVCWDFDEERLKTEGAQVDVVDDSNREFEGQTHVWKLGATKWKRQRTLCVTSLKNLVQQMIEKSELSGAPLSDWLPDNYF